MYSRGSRYFKIPPADRKSDSALAELLSGNTLVHQSSLPRWMLFVLVIYIVISHLEGYRHLSRYVFSPTGRSSDGRPAAP